MRFWLMCTGLAIGMAGTWCVQRLDAEPRPRSPYKCECTCSYTIPEESAP